MTSICATVLLFTALADLPKGSCALVCELRNAWVGVETPTRGTTAMPVYDDHGSLISNWADVYRVDGKWSLVLETEPEQCWRGGFAEWGGE